MTMGIVLVDWRRPAPRPSRRRENDVDLEPDQLGRQTREPIVSGLGVAGLEHHVLALDIAELAEAKTKRLRD